MQDDSCDRQGGQNDRQGVKQPSKHFEKHPHDHRARGDIRHIEGLTIQQGEGGEDKGAAQTKKDHDLRRGHVGRGSLEKGVFDGKPGHRADHPQTAP